MLFWRISLGFLCGHCRPGRHWLPAIVQGVPFYFEPWAWAWTTKITFWDHRIEFAAQSTALLQEQKIPSYFNSCMRCSRQSAKRRFAKGLPISLGTIINTISKQLCCQMIATNLRVSHLSMPWPTRQFLASINYANQSHQHEQSQERQVWTAFHSNSLPHTRTNASKQCKRIGTLQRWHIVQALLFSTAVIIHLWLDSVLQRTEYSAHVVSQGNKVQV